MDDKPQYEYDDFTFMSQELIASSLTSTYILQSFPLLYELTNSDVFETDNNGQEDDTKLTTLMNQFFEFSDLKLGNIDSFFLIFMFSLMSSIDKIDDPSPNNPFVALIKENTFCNLILKIMKGNELLNNLTEEELQKLSNNVVSYVRNNGQQEEPVAAQEEPVAAQEEPQEEPVAAQEEPVAAQEEPVAAQEEPVAAQEEPQEEPVAAQEEPVAAQEEPVAAQEEPVAAQEEPVAAQEELKKPLMNMSNVALPAGGSLTQRGGIKIPNIMSILSIIIQVCCILVSINYDYVTFFSQANIQLFNRIKILATTVRDVRMEVGKSCPVIKVPKMITLLTDLTDLIGLQILGNNTLEETYSSYICLTTQTTYGIFKQFDQSDLFNFDPTEYQRDSTMEQDVYSPQMPQITAPQEQSLETPYSTQLATIEDPFLSKALMVVPADQQTKLNNVTLVFIMKTLNETKPKFQKILDNIKTVEDLNMYVSFPPELFLQLLNSEEQTEPQEEPTIQVDKEQSPLSKLITLFNIGKTLSSFIIESFEEISSQVDKQYATFFVNEIIWTFQAYLKKKLHDYNKYKEDFTYNSNKIITDIDHTITNLIGLYNLWPRLLLVNTFALKLFINLFKKATQYFGNSKNIGTKTVLELDVKPFNDVITRRKSRIGQSITTESGMVESDIRKASDILMDLRNGKITKQRNSRISSRFQNGGTNLKPTRKYNTKKHKRYNKRNKKSKRKYLF